MSSRRNMQKKNSGKKPIDKIVVCGDSYSLPGQNGVQKVWPDHLQDALGIQTINLTEQGGLSNTSILRQIHEYIWSNGAGNTAFIIQWSSIDRIEFSDEKAWYAVNRPHKDHEGNIIYDDRIILQLEKLRELQAVSHSVTQYFWHFYQQIMTLDHLMQKNNALYFQMYVLGKSFRNLYEKSEYWSRWKNSIQKSLQQTSWLYDDILISDLDEHRFESVEPGNTHFSKHGHRQLANYILPFIKTKWQLQGDIK